MTLTRPVKPFDFSAIKADASFGDTLEAVSTIGSFTAALVVVHACFRQLRGVIAEPDTHFCGHTDSFTARTLDRSLELSLRARRTNCTAKARRAYLAKADSEFARGMSYARTTPPRLRGAQ